MKLGRTVGVGVTLVAALLIAGCSTGGNTPAPSDGTGEKPSTQFREPTNQTTINPGANGYVDPNDTTRQDGSKDVKYISENVQTTDPISGDDVTGDQTTVFHVTSSKVTPAGELASAKVFALKLNDEGEAQPTEIEATDLKTYTVTVTAEYKSGFKDGIVKSKAPVIWPVSSTGATSYIVSGDAAGIFNAAGGSATLTVATPKDAAAPMGVRFLQFNDALDDTIAPTVDIFAGEGVNVGDKKTQNEG